jgi:hypothetical protein
MGSNRKARALGSLVLALALAYALTWIFDSRRSYERNAAFTWIDKDLLFQADGIRLSGLRGSTVLRRKQGLWVIEEGGKDYPVKQLRVDDFLGILSRRGAYPLRASSAGAAERLGVSEGSASRIIIRGGAGLPLLDLLLGKGDATGREIYLRLAGRNEVRSGEDFFTQYLDPPPASWYDLRLFPDPSKPETGAVQRVRVSAFDGNRAYSISRNNAGWNIEDSEAPSSPADTQKAESWLRAILDAEAEDFSPSIQGGIQGGAPGNPEPGGGRLTLELGDGSARTLLVGPPDEEGRRDALVSPLQPDSLSYRLAAWTVTRLFREPEYFRK